MKRPKPLVDFLKFNHGKKVPSCLNYYRLAWEKVKEND